MNSKHLIVLVTCPTEAEADRLAACVQVTPCRSVYRWNGAVQRESEWVLALKTVEMRWPDVEKRVRALHPYEVPEIIALPILAGSGPYLNWIEAETIDAHE